MDIDHDKMFYEHDLQIQLEITVVNYKEGRQRYWENLSGRSAIAYDQAERFAEAVLKSTGQLMSVEEVEDDLSKLQNEINKINRLPLYWKRALDILSLGLPEDKKRERLEELAKEWPADPQSEDSPLKLVWERFIIDMSCEAIEKIVEGASRIFQLYDLVLRSTPSKSTQEFLARLSRCYIWGFDPECVILCRAVIDTGFYDFVPDDICEKHRQFQIDTKGEHYYTLANRVKASFQEGIIDKEIKQKAFTIKERGDKAVHRQPGITKDVWGTIRDTVAVLETIAAKRQ